MGGGTATRAMVSRHQEEGLFLGELEDIDGITFPSMQDITITQNDFGILPVDKSNQIPCFVYRPEGKPEKEGPEEGLKVVEETEVRRERTGVEGELSNIINVNKWGLQFEAGRVSQCVDNWAKIMSDPTILSQIRNFKLEFTEEP